MNQVRLFCLLSTQKLVKNLQGMKEKQREKSPLRVDTEELVSKSIFYFYFLSKTWDMVDQDKQSFQSLNAFWAIT